MELMSGRICALALMPGRICALELMPGRIQSKNETIHVYKYNITFIDKYFIGKTNKVVQWSWSTFEKQIDRLY